VSSYAEIIRQIHAVAVAYCDSQARIIRLAPPRAADDSDAPLNIVGEDVLVKKANLALELAQQEDVQVSRLHDTS